MTGVRRLCSREAIFSRKPPHDVNRSFGTLNSIECLSAFGMRIHQSNNLGFAEAALTRHSGNLVVRRSRRDVYFAVLDIDTKDAIHAVLEQVHPDSIAIFKLDQEPSQTGRSGFGIDA